MLGTLEAELGPANRGGFPGCFPRNHRCVVTIGLRGMACPGIRQFCFAECEYQFFLAQDQLSKAYLLNKLN